MAESRLAVVTTAAPYQPGKGDQGPGAPYNGAAKFFAVYSGPSDSDPDLRVSHIAIDRDHTTAEDQNSYFPLPAFRRLVADGALGGLGSRFHGLPTNRSQKPRVTSTARSCCGAAERTGSTRLCSLQTAPSVISQSALRHGTLKTRV